MGGALSASRASRRIAWALFALVLALDAIDGLLLVLERNTTAGRPYGFPGGIALVATAFGAVGVAVATRHPRNAVGWIGFAVGIGVLGSNTAQAYGVYALATAPGSVPGGHAIGWVGTWSWVLGVVPAVTFLPLLFPGGNLPSPLWRIAVWWAAAATVAMAASSAAVGWPPSSLTPDRLAGATLHGGASAVAFQTSFAIGLGAAVACVTALVRRLRRARGDERLQLKWLAYALALVIGVLAVQLGSGSVNRFPWAEKAIVVAMLTIPLAIGVAILKYRLYDIDVIINRTVLFGALAVFIAGVYVVVVVGIGSTLGTQGKPNAALSVTATAIVALAFHAVRLRAERLANRFVYGQRMTPEETLSGFADRVAVTYATEDALPRMARIVAEGTGSARADVWLRVGDRVVRAGCWPAPDVGGGEERALAGDDLPAFDDVDRTIPVRHAGELLGALTVAKRGGEPVTATEDNLLRDLAAQAALVLRNVRLTAELAARLQERAVRAADLRSSRQRIVAAQDAERRRIERDIHDGAQQHLVAIAVQLGIAKTIAKEDAQGARPMIAELRRITDEALETLRDLSRGIYPPLLAEQGLPAAVRAQAAKLGLRCAVDDGGVERYAPEVEAAVYFSCSEALQNAAKHAVGADVVVRLEERDGELAFSVTDDGAGFDPAGVASGSGLGNMTDRVAALGGWLEVRAAPGAGATVSGRLPVRAAEPVG